jgi:hypothetical protein
MNEEMVVLPNRTRSTKDRESHTPKILARDGIAHNVTIRRTAPIRMHANCRLSCRYNLDAAGLHHGCQERQSIFDHKGEIHDE